jgi:hypothetical protein
MGVWAIACPELLELPIMLVDVPPAPTALLRIPDLISCILYPAPGLGFAFFVWSGGLTAFFRGIIFSWNYYTKKLNA